jgi:hypothetical protein
MCLCAVCVRVWSQAVFYGGVVTVVRADFELARFFTHVCIPRADWRHLMRAPIALFTHVDTLHRMVGV